MNLMYYSMLLWFAIAQIHAKSFGVVGEVFPIAEKNFLTLIEERLATLKDNGELDAMNQRWIQTAAAHANRPDPLPLRRTQQSTTHNYRPEISLSQDIRDDKGHVLYARGTTVNALQSLPSYQPCWLFFNADDEAQLHWAEKQITRCANPKLILTGGAIKSTSMRLQSTVYFDQAGRITSKLHITHVPAKVTREQNHLVIDEQAIKENSDAL
ncbi:conjugal transfer pilus assembly protein TraW [Legionella massiliensis]|uniref:Conjugal transfer pilus assembly protein TraW n=2 Tax=Legionella massiliensis TaxID=1034943 RepID=A0A078L2L5_9GAMM|nr:conjugal transfer pilus assembly protein TraW [Legionella massiliensis]CEE15144.1 hypothetical protein BN1094_03724 [Legionella massiliensis]